MTSAKAEALAFVIALLELGSNEGLRGASPKAGLKDTL
jgi:hypothetical protein